MNNILYDQMGGHVFARRRRPWRLGRRDDIHLGRRGPLHRNDAGAQGRSLGSLPAPRGPLHRVVAHRARALFLAGRAYADACADGALLGASRFIIGMEFGVQETMVMRVTPDEYRGRVFTTDRALELTMMMISMVVGGWLLTRYQPAHDDDRFGHVERDPGHRVAACDVARALQSARSRRRRKLRRLNKG